MRIWGRYILPETNSSPFAWKTRSCGLRGPRNGCFMACRRTHPTRPWQCGTLASLESLASLQWSWGIMGCPHKVDFEVPINWMWHRECPPIPSLPSWKWKMMILKDPNIAFRAIFHQSLDDFCCWFEIGHFLTFWANFPWGLWLIY